MLCLYLKEEIGADHLNESRIPRKILTTEGLLPKTRSTAKQCSALFIPSHGISLLKGVLKIDEHFEAAQPMTSSTQ